MKFCCRCNASYPLTFFNRDRTAIDGHDDVCTACRDHDFEALAAIQARANEQFQVKLGVTRNRNKHGKDKNK